MALKADQLAMLLIALLVVLALRPTESGKSITRGGLINMMIMGGDRGIRRYAGPSFSVTNCTVIAW